LQGDLRGPERWLRRLGRLRPPRRLAVRPGPRGVTARHTARSEQTPHANPATPSPSAAEQLSPAFPQRAAWGTAKPLRAWQAAALEKFRDLGSQDFLAVATPGAGKTTFALRAATDLLAQGVVRRVTVVCPTEHLKVQWAQAAERVGISLDPAF